MPRSPEALISAKDAIGIRDCVGSKKMPKFRCPVCEQSMVLVKGSAVGVDHFEHHRGAKKCVRSDSRRGKE